jgi:hypothetical protein
VLSNKDLLKLKPMLDKIGLPVTFDGDRFAAFQEGITMCLHVLRGVVTLVEVKEDGKKEVDKGSNQEAGGTEEKSGSQEGPEDTVKKAEQGSEG